MKIVNECLVYQSIYQSNDTTPNQRSQMCETTCWT